jgi:hypothetical protein
MQKKSLLASVALFGQFYNSDNYKDIISIIGDFIKGAILLKKKFSVTPFEIKILLEETYDFQLPESVIRTVLHSALKNDVESEKGNYCFKETIANTYEDLSGELEKKESISDSIFLELKKYISEKELRILSSEDETILFDNFTQYLFDNGSSERYTNHISTFIVKLDKDGINNLNEIREGLILYQGIKYTSNLNKIEKWDQSLTIYLNTEYLFNALGYNGVLFKDIFSDFHKLVEEINQGKQGKRIYLKIFTETVDEIESFFYSAESILKRKQKLRPWKTAMKFLVEDCKEPSDIINKKVSFYKDLEKLGIKKQEFDLDFEEYAEFNVDDPVVIEELKKMSKIKNRTFDEEGCAYFFKIFSKINYFRKGKNNRSFEKISHIFITDSSFGKYLGHNNSVKIENSDASFVKDIDYVTTRFWIKLKKGFSEKTEFPKSFNVLTKARIILSSQINSSLSKEYDKLVEETNSGKLTEEEALERSYALRQKPNLPMELNSDNIESTFDFLNNEDYLQNIYQEKIRKDQLIVETQQKNIELQRELDIRNQKDKEREEKERKKLEAKKLLEIEKKHQAELAIYYEKLNRYVNTNWKKEYKIIKWHFWKYLLFVIFMIVLVFIFIYKRDSIILHLGFEVSENSKFIYTIVLWGLGFLATTIRSFFDTKNVRFALNLMLSNKERAITRNEKEIELTKDYKKNHIEPSSN